MKNIKRLSIVFANLKFKDGSGSKGRPVYILKIEDKYYRILRITSKFKNKSESIKEKYFEIRHWKEAGLWKPSWIDTVQGYNLPINTETEELGELSSEDKDRLFDFIQEREGLFD